MKLSTRSEIAMLWSGSIIIMITPSSTGWQCYIDDRTRIEGINMWFRHKFMSVSDQVDDQQRVADWSN